LFLSPLLDHPEDPWILINGRTKRPLAHILETAFDAKSRNKGLLGRHELRPDTALILAPCSSIHTFFMQFAIDVAFVNRRGVVVRAVHTIRPWKISLSLRAFAVVELPAGVLAATDTRPQDLLRLTRG
jgi:uncharacterized protein